VSKFKNLRVFGPIGALLCLFAVVQMFSLVHAAREANQVDSEKTELALGGALKGQVDRIAGVASDNAFWDDAAAAVYKGQVDREFARRTWGASTGDGVNYDGAYLLDSDQHMLIGLRDGKDDMRPIETQIGPAIALLRQRSKVTEAVGGVVMMNGRPVLAGLAQIWPTSQHTGLSIPSKGSYSLLFLKRIDDALLDQLQQAQGQLLVADQCGVVVGDSHLDVRAGSRRAGLGHERLVLAGADAPETIRHAWLLCAAGAEAPAVGHSPLTKRKRNRAVPAASAAPVRVSVMSYSRCGSAVRPRHSQTRFSAFAIRPPAAAASNVISTPFSAPPLSDSADA